MNSYFLNTHYDVIDLTLFDLNNNHFYWLGDKIWEIKELVQICIDFCMHRFLKGRPWFQTHIEKE